MSKVANFEMQVGAYNVLRLCQDNGKFVGPIHWKN